MYRHVHIRSPATSRSVDEAWRISDLSAVRGIDIWRWVQTLSADFLQSSDKIMTIITKAVNLVEVNILTFASLELLVTLRRCCPSLRSLKIRVDPESHEVMAQVGLFEHVKQLGILSCRSESYAMRSIGPSTNVPSWNMLAVTHFYWQNPSAEASHEFAFFMSRCRFTRLIHLDIRLLYPDYAFFWMRIGTSDPSESQRRYLNGA
jgi:hypothetical protein